MSHIIKFLLEKHQFSFFVLIMLTVLGTQAYMSIPKEENPAITIPYVIVSTTLRGVTPSDSDTLIVKPLNVQLQGIKGLTELKSYAYSGGGQIVLKFSAGFDSNGAILDVTNKVSQTLSTLPDDITSPVISGINLSALPIIYVNLSGNIPFREMVSISNNIKNQLYSVPGVLDIDISGIRDYQTNIIISPQMMEKYKLSPSGLSNILNNWNNLITAGDLDSDTGSFPVKMEGLIKNTNNIKEIPILNTAYGIIKLGDIANVKASFSPTATFATFNKNLAISIGVSKRTGANTLQTTRSVKQEIDQLLKRYNNNLKVNYTEDSSKNIISVLSTLQNSLILTIIIVALLIIVSLGIESGFLISLSIPFSFLMSIMVIYYFGYTLNIVVLFSLILVVGMLVDTPIVVIEYYRKISALGEKPKQAFKKSALRMTWPIISSNATTVAAFLPLLFWPGIIGGFMFYLPFTVSVVLAASTLTSLIFIPLVGSYFKPFLKVFIFISLVALGFSIGWFVPHKTLFAPIFAIIGAILYLIISRLFIKKDKDIKNITHVNEDIEIDVLLAHDFPNKLSKIKGSMGLYIRSLNRILSYPKTFVLCIVTLMVLSWAGFILGSPSIRFFPYTEPTFLNVNVLATGNLSITQEKDLAQKVQNEIFNMQDKHHDFKDVQMVAGDVAGIRGEQNLVAQFTMDLKDFNKRRTASAIRDDLNNRMKKFAGVKVQTVIPSNTPGGGNSKAIDIRLFSQDRSLLPVATKAVADKLEKLNGVIELSSSVSSSKMEYYLDIDKAKAANLNLSPNLIGQYVAMATNGILLVKYTPIYSDNQVDIIYKFPKKYSSLKQIKNLNVINTKGAVIPISAVLNNVQKRRQVVVMRRLNNQPYDYVQANTLTTVPAAEVIYKMTDLLKNGNLLPAGVSYSFGGQGKDMAETQTFLIEALIASIMLILIVLIIQFNSILQTLIVMSAMVLASTGVILWLFISKDPFVLVMSGIGLISLGGIIVNNNIILIDTFNVLRHHFDVKKAILITCKQRVRPVLLTALSTIIGLFPLALLLNIDFISRKITIGDPNLAFWKPLAITIISGMVFATILTLLVTPCFLLMGYGGKKVIDINPKRILSRIFKKRH